MKRGLVLAMVFLSCAAPAAERPAPRAPEPAIAPSPPPVEPLTDIAARHAIIAFYADVGEWAGEYAISQIEETRFEPLGDDAIDVHARYTYRCLIPMCRGDREGEDQRIFHFERVSGSWRVVRMGDHMSATF